MFKDKNACVLYFKRNFFILFGFNNEGCLRSEIMSIKVFNYLF